eukprot:403346808
MQPIEYSDDDDGQTTIHIDNEYFEPRISQLTSISNVEIVTLDEVILRAGGFGSVLAYSSTYLVQQPAYECQEVPEGPWESCDKETACGDEIHSWRVDWDSPESLENWLNMFELNCAPVVKTSLLSSMYYLGYSIGCLFIPRITDKYGRWFIFMLCMVVQFPLSVAILFSKSVELNTALSFFLGVCCVGRYNGCYINISEYVDDRYKNTMATLLLVADSLTCILVAVYNKFISKDWLYLQIFGAVLCFISAAGSFYVTETPEYLYSFYRFSQCKYILSWIAKQNGKGLPKKYIFDSERERKEIKFNIITAGSNYQKSRVRDMEIVRTERLYGSLRTTMKEFLSDKIILRNLIINIFMWILTIMAYQIISNHSNYFPGDQYTSDIIGSCVELFGYVAGEILYEKFGARKLFFFAYIFAMLGGIGVLITVDFDDAPQSQQYLEMSFAWLTRFGISITYEGLYMTTGLFPILFASTSFGICNLFAGLAGLFSFEVLLKQEDTTQFMFYVIFCLVGSIVSLFQVEDIDY